MAGHSKWKQIKRKKGVKDKERGALFAKLSRHIMVAAAEGGGTDPSQNLRLRLALEQAKKQNMPHATIERTLASLAEKQNSVLSRKFYEAFGPGKAAMLIEALTDNENRTVSEIKQILRLKGGKFGAAGSVVYMFRHCGLVTIPKTNNAENKVFLFADSCGALDIETDAESYVVTIPYERMGEVGENLTGIEDAEQELVWIPTVHIRVTGAEYENLAELAQHLEALDDVPMVYVNAVTDDEEI